MTFPNTSKFVKYTVSSTHHISTSLLVFGNVVKHSLSCLIYYFKCPPTIGVLTSSYIWQTSEVHWPFMWFYSIVTVTFIIILLQWTNIFDSISFTSSMKISAFLTPILIEYYLNEERVICLTCDSGVLKAMILSPLIGVPQDL